MSPDGRAMALIITQSDGRLNLYVAPMPLAGAPVLVADIVRSAPRWSADGRELYYVGGDSQVKAIAVRTVPSLTVGMPHPLFALKQSASLLEVSRDGRFLLLMPQVRAIERPVIVSTALLRATP